MISQRRRIELQFVTALQGPYNDITAFGGAATKDKAFLASWAFEAGQRKYAAVLLRAVLISAVATVAWGS